jgi:hypothetical protein
VAVGRAARAAVPRSSHEAWEPAGDRPDPVDLLRQQAVTRVPELVPIRHARMLASPFAFYRGAAAVMATDLARTPNSGLRVQCCGDAHLANFGGFAAPDRSMVFDVNDFDETLPGPWEWDVKRLAASFDIAARSREFDDKTRTRIVREMVRSYRDAMREYAAMRNLDLWYLRLDEATVFEKWHDKVSPASVKRFQKNVAKSHTRDSLGAFAKLTGTVDGRVRIISTPPLIVPLEELMPDVAASQLRAQLHEWFRDYRRTSGRSAPDPRDLRAVDDFAPQGGGGRRSVGLRSWIAPAPRAEMGVIRCPPDQRPKRRSSGPTRQGLAHHGRRVVEGQRVMQSASDIFLGWDRATGVDGTPRDFYVRQLWDGKLSADVDTMEPEVLSIYGEMCGSTLARAHARSGDRIAIASYLGASDSFDRAIAEFATAYADQNQRDYESVAAAAKAGVIPVDESEAAK